MVRCVHSDKVHVGALKLASLESFVNVDMGGL